MRACCSAEHDGAGTAAQDAALRQEAAHDRAGGAVSDHWTTQLRDGMLKQQRIQAVASRMGWLDAEVARLAAEGHMADVDRLLDERRELESYRLVLGAGLVPNG
jgi:hypothetical protein